MAEKNIKSTKKQEKTHQTPQITPNYPKNEEILEESQKDDESNDFDESPEVDDAQETQGMVKCKRCKKEVDPYFDSNMGRWKCPQCNGMVANPFTPNSEQIKESPATKERPFEIISSRNIKFSGSELAQAEMLIESGVAKNFNDLAKKAFNVLFLKEKLNKAFGVGNNTMESNKQIEDTSEIIDKSLRQQLLQAQIDNMKKGGSQSSDPISTMVMLRMMENQGGGKDSKDNGFMDKLLQMQMMQSMSKPQVDAGLQRELTDLKYQMQTQQLLQQNQQAQQGNQSSQDHVMKIEKLRAEHDREMKKIELESQKQRDVNIQFVFDTKLKEIQSEMQRVIQEANSQGKKADLSSFKEQFKAVKELNALMGDREKGTGEMIMESLGNVAEKVAPALIELGKARQQQIAHQYIEPQQFPPQQQFQELPEGEIPSTIPHESEMSESEKQMANEMNRMYIQERK